MIYSPSDDSCLLEEQVKKYSKGKKFLDMGSGSGIQASAAKGAEASLILAVDINKEAIEILKSKGIPAVQSDLFLNISKENKFDIIAFNPPYLPKDKREDCESAIATTGGRNGDELILKFLKQSQNHLNKNGIILLLLSSLTPQNKIFKLLNQLLLKHQILSSKKLFMETLQVWKIEQKN